MHEQMCFSYWCNPEDIWIYLCFRWHHSNHQDMCVGQANMWNIFQIFLQSII